VVNILGWVLLGITGYNREIGFKHRDLYYDTCYNMVYYKIGW